MGPRASLRTLYLGRDFRGLRWPRSLSRRTIGQVLEDATGLLEQEPRVLARWRDDFFGHPFDARPHVNVEVLPKTPHAVNIHLYY
jgi:hypothetical protein